ncbi:MAG: hypothetical protein U5J64_12425 [Halobacteriales archaeon]|nr:hypothetical protein [Halobacteriales archaeon]
MNVNLNLPTRRADWEYTAGVVGGVLRKPLYAALTLVVSFVTLTVFVLPGNISLVVDVVVLGDAPLGARLGVLADLYPFFGLDTPRSVLLVVAALLVGVNLSVLVRGYRNGKIGGAGGSAVGTTLATLGAGCAACGSALLAAFFSTTAVAGGLALLPFEGLEFLVISLVVLVLSTYWTADATRESCKI